MSFDLSLGWVRFRPRLEWIELILESHDPIRGSGPLFLMTKDSRQVIPFGRAVIISRSSRRHGKLVVQLGAESAAEQYIRASDRLHPRQPQLFHQPILISPVTAFHAPFSFRRVSFNDLNVQLLTGAPKLRQ